MQQRLVQMLRYGFSCIAPLFRLIFSILGLLGMAAVIRDEFFPSLAKFHLSTLLPDWNWQTWLVIIFGVILIAVLEGAYAQHEALKGPSNLILPSGFSRHSLQRGFIRRWLLPGLVVATLVLLWTNLHTGKSFVAQPIRAKIESAATPSASVSVKPSTIQPQTPAASLKKLSSKVLPRIPSRRGDGRPLGPENLAALNKHELRMAAFKLINRLGRFRADMNYRMALLSPATSIPPTTVTEEQKTAFADYQTIYNQTLLPDIVAMRNELWARLKDMPDTNLSPDGGLDGFSPITGELDDDEGRRTMDDTLRDTVLYLQKLVSQLHE